VEDVNVEQGTSCERLALDNRGGNHTSDQLALTTQRDDRATFLELIYTYDAMVMRVALTLTGSEPAAQEIFCQVFKDAFTSMKQLNSNTSVFIWLYRILVRRCLEYCRCGSSTAPSASGHGPGSQAARALPVLPPTERMVFQLKQFQGLKIRTLAKIFDAPPEFITRTLQSAIRRLRTQLETTPPRLSRPSRVA